MSYGTERTFQLVIDALRQLEREHVRRLDAVPPLVDIAVSLALMDGGVEAAEEIIDRARKRIDDWRGGEASAPVDWCAGFGTLACYPLPGNAPVIG
jgi:hypothetical protein